jgi:hypothetical protein
VLGDVVAREADRPSAKAGKSCLLPGPPGIHGLRPLLLWWTQWPWRWGRSW